MKTYRIAFVGLGSIGMRHLRNVCELLSSRGDICQVDLYRSRLQEILPTEIVGVVKNQFLYADEIGADKMYDVVFVTNPTSIHYETLLKFAPHTKAFFVEKPVFNVTEVDESIFECLGARPTYVACPLRYNPVLTYIREHIPYKQTIAARAISSSYLPDWRPGQDYRRCYSAHRNMGGGVGIDLIHEWDYLTLFFGMPNVCYSIQDKISDLEIDSDDIAIYIARTQQTTIELHLDYFGRKTVRTLDLFLPDETIRCDITNGQVDYLRSGRSVTFNVDRNQFQMAEIRHFFDIIDGKTENDSDVRHAYNVLKLAKGEF